jgi:hypothetical protein
MTKMNAKSLADVERMAESLGLQQTRSVGNKRSYDFGKRCRYYIRSSCATFRPRL